MAITKNITETKKVSSMLEALAKRVKELEAIFEQNKDQLNALLGRLTEARELYEAACKASFSQVVDGVEAGLEKIEEEEEVIPQPEGRLVE